LIYIKIKRYNTTFNVKATKENIFQIPKNFDKLQKKLEWFSIDPLKVLIEIKSIYLPSEMLIKQLKNGNTVNEKI